MRVFLISLSLCCIVQIAVSQETPRAHRSFDAPGKWEAVRVATAVEPDGTAVVQYDPGFPPDTLGVAPLPGSVLGNLFDTASGQPLASGALTRISWYQGSAHLEGTVLAGFVGLWSTGTGYGQPFSGGQVSPLDSFGFNAISAPGGIAVPSRFIVGVYVPTYTYYIHAPVQGTHPWGSIGLRSASTQGQGFHGRQLNWQRIYSASLPGQNAMVRVAGDVVVPVELMEFDID